MALPCNAKLKALPFSNLAFGPRAGGDLSFNSHLIPELYLTLNFLKEGFAKPGILVKVKA